MQQPLLALQMLPDAISHLHPLYLGLNHLEGLLDAGTCLLDVVPPFFLGLISAPTEPKSVGGWKGALEVTSNTLPAKAASPSSGCTGAPPSWF